MYVLINKSNYVTYESKQFHFTVQGNYIYSSNKRDLIHQSSYIGFQLTAKPPLYLQATTAGWVHESKWNHDQHNLEDKSNEKLKKNWKKFTFWMLEEESHFQTFTTLLIKHTFTKYNELYSWQVILAGITMQILLHWLI